MRFGVLASVLLHACAVGLAFLSLPQFMRTKVVEAPVIPIELIDKAELAERTSVPAASPKPKPPEQKKAASEEKKPEEKKPEEKKPEEKKPEPEPIKKPEPEKPKDEPKKDPPKKDPPKKDPPKKSDDLDLDALEALIDKSKKDDRSAEETGDTDELAEFARDQIGEGDRLTASEIDKMRAAVSRCWNASAIIGAPAPEKLVVEIDIDLNRDGTLSGSPRVVNALEINLSGNRFWKVAEQNAVRAVQACQPYNFFDPARYNDWKAFTLNFDPSIMAGF